MKEGNQKRVKMTDNEIILKGNIWKAVWQLSWPAVLGMLLYSFNTLIDMMFVGRFVGEQALSGVTIASPLFQIPSGIGSLIGVGAGAVLSIAIGKKDTKTQEQIVPVANALNLIFAAAYMILAGIILMPFLKMMGAEGASLVYAYDYFSVLIYGALFMISGFSYNMIVRAEGKMRTAMLMMSTGLVVNIICNYFFVAVFGLGVKGIAWGTNIGMFIYTMGFFVYAGLKKASFNTNYKKISFTKAVRSKILALGFPSSIMSFMTLIQGVVIIKVITSIGTDFDVALYGVAYRYLGFFIIPMAGFMRASQPFFGQCYGAGLYDRIVEGYKQFTKAGILFLMPFWALSLIFPEVMIGIMMPDTALTAADLFNFRTAMVILPVIPIMFIAMSLFPAVEKPKPAAILGISRQLLLYVPTMLIMPRLFGTGWVYKGSFLIDLIMIFITFVIVRKQLRILRNADGKDSIACSPPESL